MGLPYANQFWVLFAAAFCAVAGSALAQTAVPDANQSLLFSAPQGNAALSPDNIPSSSRSSRLNLGGQIQAPQAIFNQGAPGDSLEPAPAPPPMNALRQMMQEHKKNWTEMTPEEIFGLQSPAKEGDPKKLDANRDDSYQSPLEKFLMQQRLAQTGSTNMSNGGLPNEGWNFLDEGGLPNQKRLEGMRNGSIANSQIFNRWLQNAQNSADGSQQNQDDAWMRVFVSPQVESQSKAQIADMEAFKQMLQSELPSPNFKNSAPGNRSMPSTLPLPDSNLEPQRAGYNPMGASFLPLNSGISRPKRLAPLPTLISSGLSVPTAPPSWAPKPPPWMVEGPKPFVIPVRKF